MELQQIHNLNTYHVSINPDVQLCSLDSKIYLNTYHVSINHDASAEGLGRVEFKYISCFY